MARKTSSDEWEDLWSAVGELSEQYGSRIVFIGGVAVYLHVTAARAPESYVEFSHDGDFYISLADFGELRDTEEVTYNRRLSKGQIIKRGIDFDVYVERQATLLVSYADVEAASVVIEHVRVASLEHLLLLKLDAHRDRRGSAKGQKDERDLIRIGYLLNGEGADRELLAPYLTRDMVAELRNVGRSSQFLVMCRGNAHEAARLRKAFDAAIEDVAATLPRRQR